MLHSACHNKKLSNVFYWHVCVECESEIPEVKSWYENIRAKYLETLQKETPAFFHNIQVHIKFREVIQKMVKEIKKTGNAQSKTVA
jgi:hypothetical protein